MQISPSEIDSVEEAGTMNAAPVKLIKTKGGFWIAIGKAKGKLREEALAAGSHPAIVKYNMEKMFPEFEPSLMKSELFAEEAIVDKHSHFLSDELRKSGHDIYSVQQGEIVSFQITKHNVKVAEATSHLLGDTLTVNDMNFPREFSRAMAGATVEKAMTAGLNKVRVAKK